MFNIGKDTDSLLRSVSSLNGIAIIRVAKLKTVILKYFLDNCILTVFPDLPNVRD